MIYKFEAKFELGDRVFYKLPDSPEGMVTGIGYSLNTNLVTYYVTFDPLQVEATCFDWELSSDRVVI